MSEFEPIVHDRIRIIGVGRLGRAAAEMAAARHTEVTFELYSRHPSRHVPSIRPNLRIFSLDRFRATTDPVVIALSVDEAEIVRQFKQRRPADQEVPRTVVAEANLTLLKSELPLAELGCQRIFVVTNPVELICAALVRWTDNPRVYGFGMETDWQRAVESLHFGFGLKKDALAQIDVTGLHYVAPIVQLSASEGLGDHIRTTSPARIETGLRAYRSPVSPRPEVAAVTFLSRLDRTFNSLGPQARLRLVMSAIIASEFEGARPPVARSQANLGRFLSDLATGRPIRVAAMSEFAETGPGFLGGWLRGDAFIRPLLDLDESAALAADLATFRDHTDQFLKGAP